MKSIVMPKLGMATMEADILTWKVKEGDHIKKGDAVVEIESEKVNVTVESEYNGVVAKLLFKDGDTVPVGEAICEIDESQ
jgi:pyruvate/2-oxoglutarate dehydrogenase complex dihydrolipoamide acyltransferase (E2) component